VFNKVIRVLLCFAFFGVSLANAEQYPSKVITIVVPFSAGGPTDTSARLLGQTMGAALKTQMIVENVAGAGGTIAAARVASSPPDGSTISVFPPRHPCIASCPMIRSMILSPSA
jgi:tripartite-type tricarboxylate transporter receptor subunit TctC